MKTALISIVCLSMLCVAASCHHGNGSGVSVVGDDLAKADVRRTDALAHLAAAKPGCSATAQVHVDSASVDLTNQGGDLKQAQTDLKTVQGNYDTMKGKYDSLNNNPWVKFGLWLEKAFWWTVAILASVIVAATAAIMFLPAASGLSVFIIRAFPLMNFATHLRDWYQDLKVVLVPTKNPSPAPAVA